MENKVVPNMPSSEYHASKAIGSSLLVKMLQSPKHFHHAWTKGSGKATDAMERGTFLHSLLLEQDVANYIPRPMKDGKQVAVNTKEYAAFLAANPGKKPIHPNEHAEMLDVLSSFCENTKAMQMLKVANIEHSIFAEDPTTDLEIKARPDIWGKTYIADLKTVSNIDGFERNIFKNQMDVRLAHYAKCIEFATGDKIKEFYFIAFEQSAPFDSMIYQLSMGDVSAAFDKWRAVMIRIAECNNADYWPGYPNGIRIAQRPKYLEDISFEEAI